MRRNRFSFAPTLVSAIALLAIATSAVAEPPPPPPPPPPGSSPVDDSCPTTPPLDVKAEVVALAPADIGLPSASVGHLTWRWGFRITAADPRVDQISGLELNPRIGILAVTHDGAWLAFDLDRGTLDQIHSVTIAPIRGIHGAPVGLVSEAYDSESVLFADESVSRLYDFKACGLGAHDRLYVGESASINLDYRASAKPIDGFHLIAASEADRFTPDLRPSTSDFYSIWRANGHEPTTLVNEDGHGAGINGPRELARLPHVMTAMFAIYSAAGQKVDLFMADEVGPGVVDIYRFSVD